jgi:hypothetical protein
MRAIYWLGLPFAGYTFASFFPFTQENVSYLAGRFNTVTTAIVAPDSIAAGGIRTGTSYRGAIVTPDAIGVGGIRTGASYGGAIVTPDAIGIGGIRAGTFYGGSPYAYGGSPYSYESSAYVRRTPYANGDCGGPCNSGYGSFDCGSLQGAAGYAVDDACGCGYDSDC